VVVIRRPCFAVAGHELCSHKLSDNHVYHGIGKRKRYVRRYQSAAPPCWSSFEM
jgi:hypothetical protein